MLQKENRLQSCSRDRLSSEAEGLRHYLKLNNEALQECTSMFTESERNYSATNSTRKESCIIRSRAQELLSSEPARSCNPAKLEAPPHQSSPSLEPGKLGARPKHGHNSALQTTQDVDPDPSPWARDAYDCGDTDLHTVCIATDPGAPPTFVRQYRIPLAAFESIQEILDSLLEKQIICECNSTYNSPLWPVLKPSRKWRLTIDYRQLNKQVPVSRWPMIHLDQELAKVTNAKFFSTVDVANGFWTMKVDPVDQYKLAFSFGNRQFTWNRCLFSYSNSTAEFNIFLHKAMSDTDLVTMQKQDLVIKAIYQFVSDPQKHPIHLNHWDSLLTSKTCLRQHLQLEKGVLVYTPSSREPPQWIVPTDYRGVMIVHAHDAPCGGHRGSRATYKTLRNLAYWPFMAKDIMEYVKGCLVCY
ncbi:hypothetical protein SKAU_G00210410 [Synaphobranchus kaupii]|uniref:Gypsy retrotransposon integrase-like protein 1 n=1 Tax=Synaphobranchus kaupii TaxID=118154 RepID=A0A9Q1F8S9_SYNKA|nr:hypothetical protein SKAU_G00210410 [Synaphobranchus kaupii]